MLNHVLMLQLKIVNDLEFLLPCTHVHATLIFTSVTVGSLKDNLVTKTTVTAAGKVSVIMNVDFFSAIVMSDIVKDWFHKTHAFLQNMKLVLTAKRRKCTLDRPGCNTMTM